MSYFDKGKDTGRGSVNIQISMVGDKQTEVIDEPQDIEYETVDVRPEN
jgi:hypothetical protein